LGNDGKAARLEIPPFINQVDGRLLRTIILMRQRSMPTHITLGLPGESRDLLHAERAW
jgi:hypothetical protein